MNRNRKFALGLLAILAGLGVASLASTFEAKAQRDKDEPAWEYAVVPLSYNPGERLSDEQRAKAFAKVLNDEAKRGWEPVGSVLSRDSVQTVGGAVTTRDTVSFVALRRPRR